MKFARRKNTIFHYQHSILAANVQRIVQHAQAATFANCAIQDSLLIKLLTSAFRFVGMGFGLLLKNAMTRILI